MGSSDEDQEEKKISEVQVFPVPFSILENKNNISISTNTENNPSKDKIRDQAIKFHLEGNIKESAKYYQYFIKQGFKDHIVFSNYGLILRDLGNLKEAELSIRKAIEINPNDAMAYSNLGIILKDLGNLKEAELNYRKAIELNPDFAEAHSNLGRVLKDLGNLKEAEQNYRKAIELKPNYAGAYKNLGIVLGNLGNIEESISSFNSAKRIKPNDLTIYEGISFTLRDYIWFTNNYLYKQEKNIEELVEIEKKKLKFKLKNIPIWFVDIPRSSSTTTQLLMWNNFGWPFGKRTKIVNGEIVHERSLLMPNHTPALITKYLIGEKYWASLNSFTIVRNPYTWCLSLWQSELNDRPEFRYQCGSFIQFLNLLEENLKVEFKNRKINHLALRQTDYILDENRNILVKELLKFEDKKSIKSYFMDNNISFKQTVHINKTTNNNQQITNSEKRIIERIFEKDFEILGY